MAKVQHLVHKQFNSPIGLYSDRNVKETLNRELRVLSNGSVGIDFEGDPSATKPGNLANSAVLKMLEEEERQKDGKRSGGLKRVAWPPTPERSPSRNTQQDQQQLGGEQQNQAQVCINNDNSNTTLDENYTDNNSQQNYQEQEDQFSQQQIQVQTQHPQQQQQQQQPQQQHEQQYSINPPPFYQQQQHNQQHLRQSRSPIPNRNIKSSSQTITTPSYVLNKRSQSSSLPSRPGFLRGPSSGASCAFSGGIPVQTKQPCITPVIPQPQQTPCQYPITQPIPIINQQYQIQEQIIIPNTIKYPIESLSPGVNLIDNQIDSRSLSSPRGWAHVRSPQPVGIGYTIQQQQQQEQPEQEQQYNITNQNNNYNYNNQNNQNNNSNVIYNNVQLKQSSLSSYETQQQQQQQQYQQQQQQQQKQTSYEPYLSGTEQIQYQPHPTQAFRPVPTAIYNQQLQQQQQQQQRQQEQQIQQNYQYQAPTQPQYQQEPQQQQFIDQPDQYQYQQPEQQFEQQPLPPQQQQQNFYRQPSPGIVTLRREAPITQRPAPVFSSQPAATSYQGDKMRGDDKWPPAGVKSQSEVDNEDRRKVALGPAFRPRRMNKDYSQFFAQHALNSTYPGYKAPPGTQHFSTQPNY